MSPIKRSAYHKDYYRKNKATYIAKNLTARLSKRAYIREWKSRPCTDCGESYPYYVMDVDHRPGSRKLYEPAKLETACGLNRIKEELAKCDLVCANCHRIRTFTRIEDKKRMLVGGAVVSA